MVKLEEGGRAIVRRWPKKAGIPEGNIFNLKRMVVPINVNGCHWASCHVDFLQKTLLYMDSMRSGNRLATLYLELMRQYLEAEHLDQNKKPLEQGWRCIDATKLPQQTNGNDCGVFTLSYAILLTAPRVAPSYHPLGIWHQLSQESMDHVRHRLARNILRGSM